MHFAGRASPDNDVIVHKAYMRRGHVDENINSLRWVVAWARYGQPYC